MMVIIIIDFIGNSKYLDKYLRQKLGGEDGNNYIGGNG